VCCCVNMLPAQSRGACAFCAIMPLCVVYGPGTEPCTGERACRASAMARATLPPAVDFCKLRSFAGSLTLRLQSEGVAHARTRMHAREHTPSVTSWHARTRGQARCAPAYAHQRKPICVCMHTPTCAQPAHACARSAPPHAAPAYRFARAPGRRWPRRPAHTYEQQSCLFLTGRR